MKKLSAILLAVALVVMMVPTVWGDWEDNNFKYSTSTGTADSVSTLSAALGVENVSVIYIGESTTVTEDLGELLYIIPDGVEVTLGENVSYSSANFITLGTGKIVVPAGRETSPVSNFIDTEGKIDLFYAVDGVTSIDITSSESFLASVQNLKGNTVWQPSLAELYADANLSTNSTQMGLEYIGFDIDAGTYNLTITSGNFEVHHATISAGSFSGGNITFVDNATLNVQGKVDISGALVIGSDSELHASTLTLDGTNTNPVGGNSGTLTATDFILQVGTAFDNSGTMSISGTFTIETWFRNNDGGVITAETVIVSDNSETTRFENGSTLNVDTMTVEAYMTNTGAIKADTLIDVRPIGSNLSRTVTATWTENNGEINGNGTLKLGQNVNMTTTKDVSIQKIQFEKGSSLTRQGDAKITTTDENISYPSGGNINDYLPAGKTPSTDPDPTPAEGTELSTLFTDETMRSAVKSALKAAYPEETFEDTTKVTNTQLAAITTLDLSSATDATNFSGLNQLTGLTTLSLTNNSSVTDTQIQSLAAAAPASLNTLNLSGCTSVGDSPATLSALGAMPSVTSLDLSNTAIDDDSVTSLIQPNSRLQTLNLSNTSMTDAGAKLLAQAISDNKDTIQIQNITTTSLGQEAQDALHQAIESVSASNPNPGTTTSSRPSFTIVQRPAVEYWASPESSNPTEEWAEPTTPSTDNNKTNPSMGGRADA